MLFKPAVKGTMQKIICHLEPYFVREIVTQGCSMLPMFDEVGSEFLFIREAVVSN